MLVFFICNPVVWWSWPLLHNVISCHVLGVNIFYSIVIQVSLFATKKWNESTSLLLICEKHVICLFFLFQGDITDAKYCHWCYAARVGYKRQTSAFISLCCSSHAGLTFLELHWSVAGSIYYFGRHVYLHWWWPLIPSVCNFLSGCALLSLAVNFYAQCT